jgi:hypothetical protein
LCARAALPVALRLNSVAFVPSLFAHNLQVSDDAVHFTKQKIFEHSIHSNKMKVVQKEKDPGAMMIFFVICCDQFALNFLRLFAEVDLTFEWCVDKEDKNPLAGSGVIVWNDSVKEKCVFFLVAV